jgi:hypothetical protein
MVIIAVCVEQFKIWITFLAGTFLARAMGEIISEDSKIHQYATIRP